MKLVILAFSTLTFVASSVASAPDKQMTQEEYITIWSNVAVEQMTLYRIPASITLAQGLLESGNGNSILATEGNNHFGIKCSNWSGETIHVDDDIKNECFRKYGSATDSYVDHSIFLKKTRYSNLFALKIEDYKGWANGLKADGYATHPQYASKLIDLIERLKLNEYDDANQTIAAVIKEDKTKDSPKINPTSTSTNTASVESTSSNNKEVSIDQESLVYTKHNVFENKNDVTYIVARKGDTYYKIAQEFELGLWQLYRYNDYGDKKDILAPGDIVYIDPKRYHSKEKDGVYIAKNDVKLYEISQQEGIKVTALMKMNGLLDENAVVPKGQKVLLR